MLFDHIYGLYEKINIKLTILFKFKNEESFNQELGSFSIHIWF